MASDKCPVDIMVLADLANALDALSYMRGLCMYNSSRDAINAILEAAVQEESDEEKIKMEIEAITKKALENFTDRQKASQTYCAGQFKLLRDSAGMLGKSD